MRNWKWIAKIWSMQSHQVGWRQTVQIVNICNLNLIELNRFKGNPRLTKERTEELGDRRRWTQSDTERPYFSSATNAQSVKIRKKGRWMFVLKKLWIVSKREMEIFFFFFFRLNWSDTTPEVDDGYLCICARLLSLRDWSARVGRAGRRGKNLDRKKTKNKAGPAERNGIQKKRNGREKKEKHGRSSKRKRKVFSYPTSDDLKSS